MSVLQTYSRLLVERPLITKCLTSLCTFGAGDLICQSLEGKSKYDYKRLFIQASFGFLFTPYFHLQFCHVIPRLFPGGTTANLVKSVAFDQTINALVFTTCFFSYIDTMNGLKVEQVQQSVKEKLLPTLFANWTCWPLIMAVNFSIVPMRYRVLFTNICGMFWVGYLSYVQNVKNKKKELQ